VPGTRMEFAMQLIVAPMIRELVAESRKARHMPT
jgi:phosphoribulokinase